LLGVETGLRRLKDFRGLDLSSLGGAEPA
jgi:hypothetical protein